MAPTNVQGPRSVALPVAVRLDEYTSLPLRPQFKVNDVLQRGSIYSFIRSKSNFFLFPDHISQLKSRFINVTSTGFMIIYETDKTGLVVDLRRVINVFCNADRFVQKSKKINYLRCHIKIRLPRGNIHLYIRDENVHKWTCAIMRAAARPGKVLRFSEPPKDVDLETAVEEEEEEEETEVETACESCKEAEEEEEMVTVIENTEVPTSSVRSLRIKLEKDLIIKPKEQVEAEQQSKRPHFVSELFCPPTLFKEEETIVLEPTDEQERKEEEKEVDREKMWWMRSLRC